MRRVQRRFDSVRPLARFTGSTYRADELGYDAEGRLVLERLDQQASYTSYGERWAETYAFQPAPGRVILAREDRWTFAADGRLTALEQCIFRDDDGRHRYGGDHYEYDDRGRVTAIERRWPADAPECLIAIYGDDTTRPLVVRQNERVIWRRPVKGLPQIITRVEDALVDALLGRARGQTPLRTGSAVHRRVERRLPAAPVGRPCDLGIPRRLERRRIRPRPHRVAGLRGPPARSSGLAGRRRAARQAVRADRAAPCAGGLLCVAVDPRLRGRRRRHADLRRALARTPAAGERALGNAGRLQTTRPTRALSPPRRHRRVCWFSTNSGPLAEGDRPAGSPVPAELGQAERIARRRDGSRADDDAPFATRFPGGDEHRSPLRTGGVPIDPPGETRVVRPA